MIDVTSRVLALFPNARPLTDFKVLSVDSAGTDQAISFWNVAIGVQPTPSQLAAVTQAQIDASSLSITHAALVAALTSTNDFYVKFTRQLLLASKDEFNRHTAVEAAMFSAVAAANSLADLKTRFAAITPVPVRVKSDLIAAMSNGFNAGDADS